ncbi:MAG: UvrD-helicase domain-containing protein [Thermoleophilia bacterium]|nr:UvrD-helicase domain-containing protein [Thermoleophilia bacterium]
MTAAWRTPEQDAILQSRAPVVFVAAGAGTGKTSVLVDRYLQALLDDRVPMQDLLTVTFTRKAAGEMRDRIRHALLERGHRGFAWALDDAPIGTIHSLCGRIVRSSPVDAGVDPSFAVLDEDRARIVQIEAMDAVWEEAAIEADDETLEYLGRHGGVLRRAVPAVCTELRGAGVRPPRFVLGSGVEVEEARSALLESIQRCLAEAAPAGTGKTVRANLERLESGAARLKEPMGDHQALGLLGQMRPSLSCGKDRSMFEPVLGALEAFHRALGERYLVGLGRAIDQLVVAFHQEYEARKRNLGVLDFLDLEIKALDLLVKGARPFGPAARLLVDEFQDTNELQCAVFDLLGAATMLTVGDAFQSIYAFRGADVEVFRSRESAPTRSQKGTALLAPLSRNFRSRRALLEIINHLFSQGSLFGSGFPRLTADRVGTDPRRSGPDCRGRLDPAAELWIVGHEPEEDSGVEAPVSKGSIRPEALFIAGRVGRLVREDGWRPRDIAVLLRNLTHVADFEEALEREGLDPYVVDGRGFYDREESNELLAGLRLLVNPHDDMALLTVLRSPFVGLSDDGLFLVRAGADDARSATLWGGLVRRIPPGLSEDEGSRVRDFVEGLRDLRGRMGSPGLAALILGVVERFDYDLVLLKAHDGRRRFANLRKLMRLADEFEALEGPDLAAFVRHVGQRRHAMAEKEGNAAVLAEGEDAIRIMTVHKAKGLEFPVVVVAGLGGAMRPRNPLALVGRSGEIGLSIKSPAGGFPRLTLGEAERVIDRQLALEAEEEARLYYVAMTRAEERLILSGELRRGRPAGALGRILETLDLAELPSAGATTRPRPGLDLVVGTVSPVPRNPGDLSRAAGNEVAGGAGRATLPRRPDRAGRRAAGQLLVTGGVRAVPAWLLSGTGAGAPRGALLGGGADLAVHAGRRYERHGNGGSDPGRA